MSNNISNVLDTRLTFLKNLDADFLKATVDDDGLDGLDGIGGREERTTSGQAGQRIWTKTANLSRQGMGSQQHS